MRPRVFPAEDFLAILRICLLRMRFNEAAGIPRGRHAGPTTAVLGVLGLQ